MSDEPRHIRIGTRKSILARTQSGMVGDSICTARSSWTYELVTFDTRGDSTKGPLADVGGKGLFTAELESALRNGDIDLAVHSAKDMPAELDEDLVIAAVPKREDPRDVLVSRSGDLDHLPEAARVGTGSFRRGVQIRRLRGDIEVRPVRGNVETRIAKALGDGAELDAVILAAAGLIRGELFQKHRENIFPLPTESFIPAAGQGVLAVQTLAENRDLIEDLKAIHDPDSGEALNAERYVVGRLQADCSSSLAVYVRKIEEFWAASAMASRPDGSGMIRLETGNCPSAFEAGNELANRLIESGADHIVGRKSQ